MNRYIVRSSAVTLLALLAFASIVSAHTDPASPSTDLATKMNGFIHVDGVKNGFVGLLITSLKDGRVLYSHDAHHLFIPASCNKLLVTSAALDKLGPDYRLKTEVLAFGRMDSDTLIGDIILKGYGDSSLDTKGLAELADAVKTAGVRHITGNVVADDSWFDNQRFGWGWSWDYEPAAYAAPVSALVLNHNCITVCAKPGKSGEPAQISFDPPTNYCRVINDAKTGDKGSKSNVWAWRERQTNNVSVGGSIAEDGKPDNSTFSIDDPAPWIGDVFVQMLKERGIAVDGKVRADKAADGAKVISTHYSEPLSSVLENINRHSINVMAECLLKTLGRETSGQGSLRSGIRAEMDFLKKIGADVDETVIQDGSGLSRADMVSPAVLVAILRHMLKSPNSKVFYDSLPTAGGDGTLYFSMRGSAAEKNLTAKTGNLGWVQSIAGYVHTKGGEQLAFALLVNNYMCSDDEIYRMRNRIGITLAEMP